MALAFRRISLLVFFLIVLAAGMNFNENTFWSNAEEDASKSDKELYGRNVKWGSCGRYVVRNLEGAGCRFPHHSWFNRFIRQWGCHYGDVPALDCMLDQYDQLNLTVAKWVFPNRPQNMNDIRNALGGKNPTLLHMAQKSRNAMERARRQTFLGR